MSTTWDEASKCPRDGQFTGKVVNRVKLSPGLGQLVVLECPEDRCEYHTMGWSVQLRPDGTIPDKVDPTTREKHFQPTAMSATRAQQVRDALASQAERSMQPGAEVKAF